MKRLLSLWPFAVFLILALLVLKPTISLNSLLGNVDWPIPPYAQQIKEISQANFFVWNDKYILTGIPTPNPLFFGWFLIALWGKLLISGTILSFINHIVILTLSGTTAFLFLNHFIKNKWAVLIGSVFYMFSSAVFNWFHIGFIFLLFSYALLPLILLFFIKANENKIQWTLVVAVGLLYGLVGTFQMQSIFIMAALLISYALFDLIIIQFSKLKIINYLKSLSLIFGIGLLINIYWIMQIFIGNSPITQNSSQQIASTMLRLNSVTDLIQSLQLLGFHDPQYETILGSYGFLGRLYPWAMTILIWGVLLIRLKKEKKKIAGFLLFLYILTVSLTLGYNAPFPIDAVYDFLVKSSIMGILFRGSYKFWLIGFISTTFLLTIALDEIMNLFKSKIINFITTIIFIFIFTLPFFQYFVQSEGPYQWPKEYDQVNDWLQHQPGEFKAVYLPSENYIFLKDKTNHISDFPNMTSPKTGTIGLANAGVTGNNYIGFLNMVINEIPTDQLGQFFGAEGIKYVIFQDNVLAKSWETLSDKGPIEEVLRKKLAKQKDLNKIFTAGSLTIYENKNFKSLVYASTETELVNGSFSYLLNSNMTKTQDKNKSFVFLEETSIDQKSAVNKLLTKNNSSVVVQNNNIIDLFLSLTDKAVSVPITQYAEGYFNEDKWGVVTNAYYFKNINYTASLFNPVVAGAAYASSSGQLKASLKIPKASSEPYTILVKAYTGPRASKITLRLYDAFNNKKIFEEDINTFSSQRKEFQWFAVNDFPLNSFQNQSQSNLQITVESLSGENAIEEIVLIPKSELEKAQKIVEDTLLQKNIIISASNFNNKNLFIPKEDEYTLSIKLDSPKTQNNMVLSVDDKKLNLSDFQVNQLETNVFFTKLHLTKGEHSFSTALIHENTILDDPSFEVGLWSGVLDSNPNVTTPSFLSASFSKESTEGNKSLQVTTRSSDHASAVCQSLKNLDNTSLYSFSFDYKGKKELSLPRFAFWQNMNQNNLPQWPAKEYQRAWTIFTPQGFLVPKNNDWTHYAGILEPLPNAQVIGLCFFADPSDANLVTNFYDDVQIKEIPFISMVLTNANPQTENAPSTPEITFTKINPTLYNVQIKNAQDPFTLILLENFNKGWKLSFLNDSQVKLSESDHLKINGFANGWYLTQKGNFTVNLEFSPQRYFLPGMVISLMTIFLSVTFIIFKLISKVKK